MIVSQFFQKLSKQKGETIQTFALLKSLVSLVSPDTNQGNRYSSNQITKKEPKSDNRLSKFDWHNISPIFWTIMLAAL